MRLREHGVGGVRRSCPACGTAASACVVSQAQGVRGKVCEWSAEGPSDEEGSQRNEQKLQYSNKERAWGTQKPRRCALEAEDTNRAQPGCVIKSPGSF